MIEIHQLFYETGAVCLIYKCDKCGKVCTEMHPKENYFLFVCRHCKMRYVLNKKLGGINYEIGE